MLLFLFLGGGDPPSGPLHHSHRRLFVDDATTTPSSKISSPWYVFGVALFRRRLFSRAKMDARRRVGYFFLRDRHVRALCKSPLLLSFSRNGMKCRSEIARGTHRATSMHRKCADNSVILLRLRSTVEPYERNPHPQAHPEHLCRGIGRSSHQSRESARATHRATTRLFESSIHRPHVWHSS